MKKTIRIGRNTPEYHENDIPFNDPTVSRVHLQATLVNDHTIEVVDIGSVNGTYVNNRMLQKDKPLRIGPNDQVALAKLDLLVNLFDYFKPKQATDASPASEKKVVDPLDKSGDFERIAAEWESLNNKIRELKRNFQLRMSLLQGTVSFAPSILILLFAKDNPVLSQMSGIITGALVTITGIVRIIPSEKLEDQIKDLNENIQDIYKCPGVKNERPCQVRFSPQERPHVVRKKEFCANCNARYTKNKQ
jgi:hypothetical protein